MRDIYDEAFKYHWTLRAEKLLADQDKQFETHMFPLAVIGRGGWALGNWVQGYERHWKHKAEAANDEGDEVNYEFAKQHVKNAHGFGEHLRGITEQYQVTYVELDQDLGIEKVCDIFTRINSRGIRLDVFDLMNALLKPKGLQLKQLWREAFPKLNFVHTQRMNVYILQVMSILRQAYCSPKYLYYLLPNQEKTVRSRDGSLHKEVLVPNISSFKQGWSEAVAALSRTIDLLRHPQEFGAISSNYLPYFSILPVFAALCASMSELPAAKQLKAGLKLRLWYWASVFTNRYSGAVESTSARDFLDVKNWFMNDDRRPALIHDFGLRFRNLELRRETKRGTSVYNGIFNLFVLHGAQDWMTGTVPQYDDLDDHHIVPKSWGKANKLHAPIDSILNRTPLTSKTNRKVIRNRLPNKYLLELIDASGEDTVRSMLETHFISAQALEILQRDPFTGSDYDAFISERERSLKGAIEDLLVKERLDLSPRVRELDVRLESVELGLRQLVCVILEGQIDKVPEHVNVKIDKRFQSALRKNPTRESEHYSTLNGRLEFADIRELQDILTNKNLTPRFRHMFSNKEMLCKRFDQLSELRNAIRHSRLVDDITRMDGEASILWFENCLSQ